MARKSLLDRLADFCDRWYETIASLGDSRGRTESHENPAVTYKWWFVANRVTTGMVITDHTQCIVIAPVAWNRFIGMTLDVLLGQVSAQAVPIPGPYPRRH